MHRLSLSSYERRDNSIEFYRDRTRVRTKAYTGLVNFRLYRCLTIQLPSQKQIKTMTKELNKTNTISTSLCVHTDSTFACLSAAVLYRTFHKVLSPTYFIYVVHRKLITREFKNVAASSAT